LHSQAHELIHNIHEYPLDSSCANVFAFTENQRSTLLQLASLYIVSLLTPTMDPPRSTSFQATFGTTVFYISLIPPLLSHIFTSNMPHLAPLHAVFPYFLAPTSIPYFLPSHIWQQCRLCFLASSPSSHKPLIHSKSEYT